MDIPNFIRQIPVQFDHVMIELIDQGVSIKHTITRLWETQRDQMHASPLWQQTGKRLYEYYIKPLQILDYLLIGSSVLLTVIALKVCSIAAFPLCLGAGALSISFACAFSLYRIRKHFDRIAWEHVDQIRRTAHNITHQNQRFDAINSYRAKLQQPEFKHLQEGDEKKESTLKQLDRQIENFRAAALAPNYEDKKEIIQAHLDVLKELVETNNEDTALIEALEQEIDKVGKEEQDLAALEKSKQALRDLQTDDAKNALDELKQQIDALYKAIEGPIFNDNKKAFMTYLIGLQQQLAPEYPIEALDTLDEEIDDPLTAIDEDIDSAIVIDE